ncbi:MAG: patatin-like phospholipase family protein, partial [Bacteroidota bacterium]
ASLFHIGVLAALAEHDELKNIDVISCVSGGSVIGTYYYLKLKQLLEKKTDRAITRTDYIKIVQNIEEDFLNGVQKNLRMRILSNLCADFKMIFDKTYSRSHRMGELYEKYFYKKATREDEKLKGNKQIYMHDLIIVPAKEDGESFDFKNDNWKRTHKIPQLVLNATSLNTGHNWQFTASWMGEPAGNIQTEIDVKPRLRRMYYEDAPGAFKDFRLGYAVAASTCVPALFRPMPMFGLYPDIDLQLIDGGLHDNQGIAALIEQECNCMIISDASGQMPTNDAATNNNASVFFRADTILQERLRELQFMDIKERESSTQIESLLTVHLKKGLSQASVSWSNCKDSERTIWKENESQNNKEVLGYHVSTEVQALLSEIRTDLDSFNDTEAYALMYSGYAQTIQELSVNHPQDLPEAKWSFLNIKRDVENDAVPSKLLKILKIANKIPFKVFYLSLPVLIITIVAGLVACYFAGCGIYNFFSNLQYSSKVMGMIALIIPGSVIVVVLFNWISNHFKRKSDGIKLLLTIIVMTLGWVVILAAWAGSLFYLFVLNSKYNRAGKLKNVG